MLYIAILTYQRPIEEINRHLDDHRAWLAEHYREGRFLLSGPLEPRKGGLILARSESLQALESMLAEDPFAIHGLATYDVKAVNPSLRAPDFPADWAPVAKVAQFSSIHSKKTR
ncbi:MAG: YciI family protein [Halioglobus sp.]